MNDLTLFFKYFVFSYEGIYIYVDMIRKDSIWFEVFFIRHVQIQKRERLNSVIGRHIPKRPLASQVGRLKTTLRVESKYRMSIFQLKHSQDQPSYRK